MQAPVQEAVQQGQENPMTETVPGELSAGTVPENAEWTGSQQVMSGIETAENAGMLIDDASRQEAQRLSEKTESHRKHCRRQTTGRPHQRQRFPRLRRRKTRPGTAYRAGIRSKRIGKKSWKNLRIWIGSTETQPGEKPEESNVATVGRQDAAEHTKRRCQRIGKREQIQGSREVLMVSKPEELPQELTRQLLVKASSGRNEFEIRSTPKHLGEITVRIPHRKTDAVLCRSSAHEKKNDGAAGTECKGNRKCDGTESRENRQRSMWTKQKSGTPLAGRTAGSGSFPDGNRSSIGRRRTGKMQKAENPGFSRN